MFDIKEFDIVKFDAILARDYLMDSGQGKSSLHRSRYLRDIRISSRG